SLEDPPSAASPRLRPAPDSPPASAGRYLGGTVRPIRCPGPASAQRRAPYGPAYDRPISARRRQGARGAEPWRSGPMHKQFRDVLIGVPGKEGVPAQVFSEQVRTPLTVNRDDPGAWPAGT